MKEENKKEYLVEVDSNIPRELEIEASSPDEAEAIADKRIRRILDSSIFPEFWAGRSTESGKDKGFVRRD